MLKGIARNREKKEMQVVKSYRLRWRPAPGENLNNDVGSHQAGHLLLVEFPSACVDARLAPFTIDNETFVGLAAHVLQLDSFSVRIGAAEEEGSLSTKLHGRALTRAQDLDALVEGGIIVRSIVVEHQDGWSLTVSAHGVVQVHGANDMNPTKLASCLEDALAKQSIEYLAASDQEEAEVAPIP